MLVTRVLLMRAVTLVLTDGRVVAATTAARMAGRWNGSPSRNPPGRQSLEIPVMLGTEPGGSDLIPADRREPTLVPAPPADPAAAEMVARFRAASGSPMVADAVS